ncbi:MAG TPA: (deoxy)nucleoside triphosphate pyrophosphohydrolase [Thermoplasmatales archaeon]|nr:(deoxy)nucleoside triphosphate pyrophosphohydrolase [Thermoplasmatales archaeon]
MNIKAYVFLFVIVTAAIIFKDDSRILIAKRHHYWEFPGGRLEEDESMEDCIVREIKEELCLDIIPVKKFCIEKDNEIELHVFIAKYAGGELKLNFHQAAKWVKIGDLKNYKFLPLDERVVKKLIASQAFNNKAD